MLTGSENQRIDWKFRIRHQHADRRMILGIRQPHVQIRLSNCLPSAATPKPVQRSKTTQSTIRQHHVSPPPVPGSPEDSEGELQPDLNVAAASWTDDRIAGGDVGCGAPATERAGGGPGVTASTIIIHWAERIRDEGMIEHVKELDPELGVEPFLEREVLEYGEIHVLEARVAENVPAHRAKGSPLGRNQNRFAAYVAASVLERTGVGSNRNTR